MSKMCIYSDGKGNTVILPGRKTFFKYLTTTKALFEDEVTSTIKYRDPPAVTTHLKQTELTTIGISGAAIVFFSLAALVVAVLLNRRQKTSRNSNLINPYQSEPVYDEIREQIHVRGCFPLAVRKDCSPPKQGPALSPRRETNIYDTIDMRGLQVNPCVSSNGIFGPSVVPEVNGNEHMIIGQNNDERVMNAPYHVLEDESSRGSNDVIYNRSLRGSDKNGDVRVSAPYFVLENEDYIKNLEKNPQYFVLEKENSKRPDRRFSLSVLREGKCESQPFYRSLSRLNYPKDVIQEVKFDHSHLVESGNASATNPYAIASAFNDNCLCSNSGSSSDNHDQNCVILEEKSEHKEKRLTSTAEYAHLTLSPPMGDSTVKCVHRLLSVDQLERLTGDDGVTVVIFPPSPDVDDVESRSGYQTIHFSPVVKPRSRINSAPC